MKNFIYFLGSGIIFLLFPLLYCQHNVATNTTDFATQVSGEYQVHHLQVFDQMIDTSHDLVGIITITKTDASHIKLGIDIHHQQDEPTPVETLCILRAGQSKIQLVEAKTNDVLGYIEATEIHLNSSDSKGAKTEIIGKK